MEAAGRNQYHRPAVWQICRRIIRWRMSLSANRYPLRGTCAGDRNSMAYLDLPAAALAWLGRQGTRAVAVSPVIATPAFAALIGLDAALALATLVACAAVTPLTAALFAALFLGPPVAISAPALGAQLLALLAGAGLAAALVPRIAGQAWVARQAERIEG